MTGRRGAVLAVIAICALLLSPLPLHGFGLAAALALAALDVALVGATGGLAFARGGSLDERQAALRDLAYRLGFRLLGLAIVLAVVIAVAGTSVAYLAAAPDGGPSQVDSGVSGRLLVAIAELIVMLPTLVVAWSTGDAAGRGPALALALAAPVLAAAWLLALTWTPAQAAGASRNFGEVASVPGGTCRHFAAGRIVGGGFGATVGMRAEVCWNGRTAFADPDADRFNTACGADNVEDFAVVSGTTCTTTVDARGTFHYTVRARVEPLPLSIGARDVAMELIVTRDGRVLRQP